MRQQPRLDTSNVDLSRRYSFLETPMEMHAPRGGHHGDHQSPPPPVPHPNEQPPATTGQQQSNPASEKELELEHLRLMQMQQERVATPYNGPPLPEQHPAHFAPYDDEINNTYQPQHPRPQTPSTPPQPAPRSPGPLPVKMNPDVYEPPRQSRAVPIEPDANPLQTPRSPRPPPAVAATFRSLGNSGTGLDDIYANHLPGQITHPNQEIKGGPWSGGLCDCSDIGTCCLGVWCPCILYGRTQYRLHMKSRREDPTNLLGYEKCNASCTVMAFLCGFQWLLATIQHTRTRKAYDIKGDIASDCVRATCCTCCTLIQDEREIKKREENWSKAARAAGATLATPYIPPSQMSYASPPK
ncbi:hypothetical protein VTN02DRAFT_1637 [Thermoascus thermophilus]